MTWYDHETLSIWSQPWGRAIRGTLKGVQLDLLPSQLSTWGTWKQVYPHTLVMVNDVARLGDIRQRFQPNFVIGLVLGHNSKAYYFTDIERSGVVNDFLGEIPVLVWASGEIYRAFVRQIQDQVLTFRLEGGNLVDEETGSVWDKNIGLARSGRLAGIALQPIPSLSSYDWAWVDFYPEAQFYVP